MQLQSRAQRRGLVRGQRRGYGRTCMAAVVQWQLRTAQRASIQREADSWYTARRGEDGRRAATQLEPPPAGQQARRDRCRRPQRRRAHSGARCLLHPGRRRRQASRWCSVEVSVWEEPRRQQRPAVEGHGCPLGGHLDPHAGPPHVDEVLRTRGGGGGAGGGLRVNQEGAGGAARGVYAAAAAARPACQQPNKRGGGGGGGDYQIPSPSRPCSTQLPRPRRSAPWPRQPASPTRSSAWQCTCWPGRTPCRTAGGPGGGERSRASVSRHAMQPAKGRKANTR